MCWCSDCPRFVLQGLLQIGVYVLTVCPVVLRVLPSFLAHGDFLGSSCLALPQARNQPFLLTPFSGGWCLKSRICLLGTLVPVWYSALGPSRWSELQEKCVCAHACPRARTHHRIMLISSHSVLIIPFSTHGEHDGHRPGRSP